MGKKNLPKDTRKLGTQNKIEQNPSQKCLKLSDSSFVLSEEESPAMKESNIQKTKSKKQKQTEKSLHDLARKFVILLRNAPSQTLTIQEIERQLKICKRRVYDLTNIFEGLGYLRKNGSAKYSWVVPEEKEQEKIFKMAQFLEEKHHQKKKLLDDQIEQMKLKIKRFYQEHKQYLYFEVEDLNWIASVERKIKNTREDKTIESLYKIKN